MTPGIEGEGHLSALYGGLLHTTPPQQISKTKGRSEEIENILSALIPKLISWVQDGDDDIASLKSFLGLHLRPFECPSPSQESALLKLHLGESPQHQEGVLALATRIIEHSVNTWRPGYLDKLTTSTDAPGIAAELLLAFLNANVHVYDVSPALSVIERSVGRELAQLFGFQGPFAGGVSQQGGSASNLTSVVVARSSLFPECNAVGIPGIGHRLVMFVSEMAHYSLTKAAQIAGLGSENVWAVPVDENGRMLVPELIRLVSVAKSQNLTPFYVCATAGTTVLGAFDPIEEISVVCEREHLWLHVDACWGGALAFSAKQRHKLRGVGRAQSVAFNPHKMLGLPVTCSFLLSPDLRTFGRSNSTKAKYLFHGRQDVEESLSWDLADLTLQCGRRGDALKMAMGWVWYGRRGYGERVEKALATAEYFSSLVQKSRHLVLASPLPISCLQVCCYWAFEGKLSSSDVNSSATRSIRHSLRARGFMIDFAPGPQGDMLRPVIHTSVTLETAQNLAAAIEELGLSWYQCHRYGDVRDAVNCSESCD